MTTTKNLQKENIRQLAGEKSSTFKRQGKKYGSLHDLVNFACVFSLKLRDQEIGGYILHQGKQLQAIIPISIDPVDCEARGERLTAAVNSFEQGLRSLPSSEGSSFTIEVKSYRNYADRKRELLSLFEKTKIQEIKYFLAAEIQRGQQISDAGIRKEKEIWGYIRINISKGSQPPEGLLQNAIFSINQLLVSVTNGAANQSQSLSESKLKDIFRAIDYSWSSEWALALSSNFKFSYRTMDAEQAWTHLWSYYNPGKPPAIPHLLTFDGERVKEIIPRATTLDATSVLLTTLPLLSDKPQKVVINGTERASMFLYEAPDFFSDDAPGFEGLEGKRAQFRWFWANLLSRENLCDISLIVQFMPADDADVNKTLNSVQKFSVKQTEEASKYRNYSAKYERTKTTTRAALDDYAAGARTFRVVCHVNLWRSASPSQTAEESLARDCSKIASFFPEPTVWQRELDFPSEDILQSFPTSIRPVGSFPVDKSKPLLSSQIPIPVAGTPRGDKKGFELIAKDGTPVFIDLFDLNAPKNLGTFARTRVGKSVLVSGILSIALASGIPIVALDYPKEDGTSTFTDYTNFMGENGAYYDIQEGFNNLFERPDLRGFSEKEKKKRLKSYRSFLLSALSIMIVDKDDTKNVRRGVRTVLVLALNAFFDDPDIDARYNAAVLEGLGSDAWANTPTLKDFMTFCSPEKLSLKKNSNLTQAFETIENQIRYWLGTTVGQSISNPSSFRTDVQLLVFALTGLDDEMDAAILALSAYSAALRRSLSSPASIFFIDEAPILFEFDQISALIARLCANGNKAGIRVILSAQDPDTIAKSPSSSKILQNLTYILIGKIKSAAVNSFHEIMNYPKDVIALNASDSFTPVKDGMYSQWLFDNDGTYTWCRYYPSKVQLGAVANNKPEADARTAVTKCYPDKYAGLLAFADLLETSIKTGQSITDLCEEHISTIKVS
jgi:hypothetical protein